MSNMSATQLLPDKTLLGAGVRWYLACKSVAGVDKVSTINLVAFESRK